MRDSRLLLAALLLGSGAVVADEAPTGVIVDASLLDLKRCRFPKLYSPDDTMLYPPSSLFSNADYMQGYVGYMPSLTEALKQTKRIGERPWVLQPVRLHEADPTCGSVDLSAEQASQLTQLETGQQLLSQDRVLIVIGLAITATTPARAAGDAPPDTVVRIQFSKPLREGHRDRLTVYHLTAEGESPVAGAVEYLGGELALRFVPRDAYEPGERYEARLPADLQATCLAPLGAEFRLSFTIAKPAAASEPGAAADDSDKARTDPAGGPNDGSGAGSGRSGDGTGADDQP